MSDNRFIYIGSEAGAMDITNIYPVLFDEHGLNIVNNNPFNTKAEFYKVLTTGSRFSYDQFINNVECPDWLRPSLIHDLFWYDPELSVWVYTADNILFHIFV